MLIRAICELIFAFIVIGTIALVILAVKEHHNESR